MLKPLLQLSRHISFPSMNRMGLLLLFWCLTGCQPVTAPIRTGGFTVEVWSQVDDELPTAQSKLVPFNRKITLYAVVKQGESRFSDNPQAIRRGQTAPLSELGKKPLSFRWFKLEAERQRYSSKAGFEQWLRENKVPKKLARWIYKKREMDKIRYVSFPFGGNTSSTSIDQKSVTNRSLSWDGRYVGTMRYKVIVTIGDISVSSYDERYLNAPSFKKRNKVHRISVEADTGSPILNTAFAYGNLPYYYGSPSPKWQWYGSDCAKLVSLVYRRTVDKNFGYVGTGILAQKRTRSVITGINDEGVYTWNNRPIRFGHEVYTGDIVVITPRPHHTGLIGLDSNQNGLLDEEDPVLHTDRKAPTYEPLGETSLGQPNPRLKILRR